MRIKLLGALKCAYVLSSRKPGGAYQRLRYCSVSFFIFVSSYWLNEQAAGKASRPSFTRIRVPPGLEAHVSCSTIFFQVLFHRCKGAEVYSAVGAASYSEDKFYRTNSNAFLCSWQRLPFPVQRRFFALNCAETSQDERKEGQR